MKKIYALITVGILFFTSLAYSATITVVLDRLTDSPDTNIYSVQLEFSVTSGNDDWFDVDTDVAWDEGQPITPVEVPNVGVFSRWTYDDIGLSNDKTRLIFLFEDARGEAYISPLVNGTVFTLTYDEGVTLSLDFFEFTAYNEDKTSWSEIADLTCTIEESGSGNYILTFSPTAVPIPSAMLLLGSGLCVLFGIIRRK